VGMVAAVDWVLSHTEESMQGDYQKRVDLIAAAVKGIPFVGTETALPKIANHVPHLLIRFDPEVTGVTNRPDRRGFAHREACYRTEPEHGTKTQPGYSSGCKNARSWGMDVAVR